VGYQQKEIQLRPGYYSISLTAASNSLQEVVVVGYGAAARDVSEYAKKQKEEDPQLVTVNTQYQPTTIVYKIAEKYTLETDGKTTTIGIRRLDLLAGYEYFSAPKADPSVFLTARVTDWEQYELQAGEANLYFEGTYLGKTYIDLSDASDTLSLALGKDMGVSITRKLVREFSAKKMIGANRTDSRQFEITVRNTKKIPVHIIIQDQLPVATSKDIDIENVKAQDAQIDKETGLAVWTLDLLPGAEKKLQIGYSVRYPKEKKLILE
jgi:uncharacterized protein (TIGR02231 family)